MRSRRLNLFPIRAAVKSTSCAMAVVVVSSPSAVAAGDAVAGKQLFTTTCNACHSTEPGVNKIGPSLAGIFGSKSGAWSDDDFDVLANGEVVGRIFKTGVFVARPWMWTLDIGHLAHRSPTHGYAATRDSAMAAFAKSWRRE